MAKTIQGHGRSQQGSQLMEERSLIFRLSIARLGDGLEMMGVTLMHGKGQVFVAGQAITDQHAAEVHAQRIEDHVLAAAVFDTVDRSLRRGKGPQPSRTAHPPTGFVGVDRRLRSQSGQQFQEGTLGFVGHAVHGLGQAARRDAQSAKRFEHPTRGSRGQTEMLVEQGGQSQRPRAEMNLGRSGGGADLHRVRAAYFTASRTSAHIGNQTGHVWPRGREVFDELLAGFDVHDRLAATRTTIQAHLDVVVDLWRRLSMRRRMARLASRLAVCLGRLAVFVFAAERGGLSRRRPLQLLDALLQLLDEFTEFLVFRAKARVLGFKFANPLIACISVHAALPSPPCRTVSLRACAMDRNRANKRGCKRYRPRTLNTYNGHLIRRFVPRRP